ncbi:KIN14B-interacting protein [Vitis vinifera]|uniref:KIN14B-interacting protein n=1 Tax=Vitis vinifera TaxID=29760 RepID=A0A438CTM5_VITVI|nr:KIN14B-interacting protein [Vitis vinifera]
MSASSVRRIKDRGGAGGKVTAMRPSKTLTPVSDKAPIETFRKSSAGKENPRPTSRLPAVTQKPAIRAMPRIDKLSAGNGSDGESRVRWSTSSVPRGRSSSPSDFTRLLSDLRKDKGSRVSLDRREKVSGGERDRSVSRGRVSRVSVDRCENSSGGESDRSAGKVGKGVNGSRVLKKGFRDSSPKVNERSVNGLRIVPGCNDSENLDVNLKKNGDIAEKSELKLDERKKNSNGVVAIDDFMEEVNLRLNSVKPSVCSNSEGPKLGQNSDSNVKLRGGSRVTDGGREENFFVSKSDDVVGKIGKGVDLSCRGSGQKSLNAMKVSEMSKEKGASEGVGGRSGNKYPSKLHEKLAFLEGKVKRIASDIKRTKEMLEMNNPDTSKVILSDIQDKICGIEKAMGHVASDSDANAGCSKSTGNDKEQIKTAEKSQNKQADHGTSSVKGLNCEELEARLFPHHRLIRNRTSMKASLGSSQNFQSCNVESTSQLKPEEKALSPIDENPIAVEFLASLSEDNSKVTMRDRHVGSEFCEVKEMDGATTSASQDCESRIMGKPNVELILTTDETLDDEFADQENRQAMVISEETEEETCVYLLNEIGRKTTTGGWFVSEGESILLAHDDGSCSFHDIANSEEKAEYKPPSGLSPNVWRDCWIIRAPGFCSWDFYSKAVRAFHIEEGTTTRTVLGPLSNNSVYRRNALSTILAPENRQWWYKPCGPLLVSTASSQRVVKVYDIRDGEQIMMWEVQKPVLTMDYSSPLQWRNRGKVVVAEAETISLWDVSSLTPQALLSVSSSGQKITALHVNNTDAELGGGVRQRVSSSEAEGNDGVFCTPDFINTLDFRHPTGKKQPCAQVQQFSIRKQRLVSTYALPESSAHIQHTAITQVWGNSNLVMGVCGLGLFVFDALRDDGLQSYNIDYDNTQKAREIIGPDDLYSPSFDYSSSRALLISRDRPALWRHLS